ncbi:glycosyltransferase family 2 protein [Pontibacter locisalis]|uniref:Glycosyltransferase family 2 protein n=1 Tax=Pontibacter locisalis TaxID=1719035 RepID=A0ABW5IT46_9BACT
MTQLTVLMPVFNAEKHLKEAMDSILSQTFEAFEFLIIDDGSTDHSAAIVQSYKDPRIRFYQNKVNLGLTPTLNKGIKLATTELIARMDADDISYPNRLFKQVEYLQANPDCAFVSSLARVVTEDGQFVRVDRFKSEHFYYNLTFFSWIYHPTVVYRKKAVEEVNMYTVDYSEDYELFWQLSRRHKFYNLPEVLLTYRESAESLHMVTKKAEYDRAHYEQLLRNLRYYAGDNYDLPHSYLECFRHNFEPLLAQRKLGNIISCVKELDYITGCILSKKENINYDAAAIKKAAKYKRDYIISHFTRHLSIFQKAFLILQLIPSKEILKSLRAYLYVSIKN